MGTLPCMNASKIVAASVSLGLALGLAGCGNDNAAVEETTAATSAAPVETQAAPAAQLPTAEELLPRYADRFVEPGVAQRVLEARGGVDLRYVDPPPFATAGEPREPRSQVWFRTTDKLADDPLLHVCLATYVSDMTLLDSALLAHGRGGWTTGDVVGASLDHAMWFHRPFRADDWLLYDQVSPSASSALGLSTARLFQHGTLVADVAQEGLIRPLRHRPGQDGSSETGTEEG